MLSKQAQLEKNVADTKTAFDYAYDVAEADKFLVDQAEKALAEYLKEQQDND